MSELDIEALKRWDKIVETSEYIECDSNRAAEALDSLLDLVRALRGDRVLEWLEQDEALERRDG